LESIPNLKILSSHPSTRESFNVFALFKKSFQCCIIFSSLNTAKNLIICNGVLN
jgi:hypothetical protein